MDATEKSRGIERYFALDAFGKEDALVVKRSDCVFGMMYRRFRARMDNRQATVATAHAIARVVYLC